MKKLNPGDHLPEFFAKNLEGDAIQYDNLEGKVLYLSFLRTADCPFSSMQVRRLMVKQPEWKAKGLTTFTVFASTKEELIKFSGDHHPPFGILADPDETMYRSFGIGHSFIGKMKSKIRLEAKHHFHHGKDYQLESTERKAVLTGDFLINADGTIARAFYGGDYKRHLDFSEIDNFALNCLGDQHMGL